MKNVKMKVEGNILTITVDLTDTGNLLHQSFPLLTLQFSLLSLFLQTFMKSSRRITPSSGRG